MMMGCCRGESNPESRGTDSGPELVCGKYMLAGTGESRYIMFTRSIHTVGNNEVSPLNGRYLTKG